ncbi:TatD family hydrolase [Amnimonas aquatica]|uniref:DNAase n=1 Tax=Amnimonas aquatica TaxID=2094561 RepID=A0A2P6ATS3_9GAMM|nr:TatD family hydrolase [Amnimonas aquatica]PQA48549.1 DNAase [Amnimonas aquatica]
MELIDSHCHLDAPEFDADRPVVMAAARAAGVAGIVVPAYVAARWHELLTLCRAHAVASSPGLPVLWPALGLHPVHLAAHDDADVGVLADALAAHADVVAVGEIGLDRFLPELTAPAAWARQVRLFEAQLALAKQHDLPVIVHARRCHADIMACLKRVGHRSGGILHAFSGSVEEARQYRRLGLHLGLGGPLTYPQANRLRAVAQALPADAFVIETDAPDLIPHPQHAHHADGRPRQPGERVRNSPAYLPSVLATFAELRGEAPEVLAAQFWQNTVTALRLPSVMASPGVTASATAIS